MQLPKSGTDTDGNADEHDVNVTSGQGKSKVFQLKERHIPTTVWDHVENMSTLSMKKMLPEVNFTRKAAILYIDFGGVHGIQVIEHMFNCQGFHVNLDENGFR